LNMSDPTGQMNTTTSMISTRGVGCNYNTLGNYNWKLLEDQMPYKVRALKQIQPPILSRLTRECIKDVIDTLDNYIKSNRTMLSELVPYGANLVTWEVRMTRLTGTRVGDVIHLRDPTTHDAVIIVTLEDQSIPLSEENPISIQFWNDTNSLRLKTWERGQSLELHRVGSVYPTFESPLSVRACLLYNDCKALVNKLREMPQGEPEAEAECLDLPPRPGAMMPVPDTQPEESELVNPSLPATLGPPSLSEAMMDLLVYLSVAGQSADSQLKAHIKHLHNWANKEGVKRSAVIRDGDKISLRDSAHSVVITVTLQSNSTPISIEFTQGDKSLTLEQLGGIQSLSFSGSEAVLPLREQSMTESICRKCQRLAEALTTQEPDPEFCAMDVPDASAASSAPDAIGSTTEALLPDETRAESPPLMSQQLVDDLHQAPGATPSSSSGDLVVAEALTTQEADPEFCAMDVPDASAASGAPDAIGSTTEVLLPDETRAESPPLICAELVRSMINILNGAEIPLPRLFQALHGPGIRQLVNWVEQGGINRLKWLSDKDPSDLTDKISLIDTTNNVCITVTLASDSTPSSISFVIHKHCLTFARSTGGSRPFPRGTGAVSTRSRFNLVPEKLLDLSRQLVDHLHQAPGATPSGSSGDLVVAEALTTQEADPPGATPSSSSEDLARVLAHNLLDCRPTLSQLPVLPYVGAFPPPPPEHPFELIEPTHE